MLKGFRSYELAVELYEQCQNIKAKAYVADQLHRASLSIVLNIAEGSGKPTKADKRRFYAIAFGSVRETQAILGLLKEEKAIALADRLASNVYPLVYG
jgi:four helix bundle protein